MTFRFVLPLPRFVLHPITSLFLGGVHAYLAYNHLYALAAGDIEWTHIWKGFGALGGVYIFAALATRSLSRGRQGLSAELYQGAEHVIEPQGSGQA